MNVLLKGLNCISLKKMLQEELRLVRLLETYSLFKHLKISSIVSIAYLQVRILTSLLMSQQFITKWIRINCMIRKISTPPIKLRIWILSINCNRENLTPLLAIIWLLIRQVLWMFMQMKIGPIAMIQDFKVSSNLNLWDPIQQVLISLSLKALR